MANIRKSFPYGKVRTGSAERNESDTWLNANNVACHNSINMDSYGRRVCKNSVKHLSEPNCDNPLDRVLVENGNRTNMFNSPYLGVSGINGAIFDDNFLSTKVTSEGNKKEEYMCLGKYKRNRDLLIEECDNETLANEVAENAERNRLYTMMHHYDRSNELMKEAGMN